LKPLNSHQTILDFGAATGDFVKLLANGGHQVDGCELSLDTRIEGRCCINQKLYLIIN